MGQNDCQKSFPLRTLKRVETPRSRARRLDLYTARRVEGLRFHRESLLATDLSISQFIHATNEPAPSGHQSSNFLCLAVAVVAPRQPRRVQRRIGSHGPLDLQKAFAPAGRGATRRRYVFSLAAGIPACRRAGHLALYVFNPFNECLPLPARNEQGGRVGS
jgi:hypothetical protein